MSWSALNRNSGISFALAFLLVLAAGWWFGTPIFFPNSQFYVAMAQGHANGVPKPFSGRVLHPWIASVLMKEGLRTEAAFTIIAILALVVLMISVKAVARDFGVVDGMWPVLLFCPLLIQYFRTAYMNDLFYAALLAVLWFALSRAEPLVLPILLVLQLCRESTILVACVLFGYFVWQKKYRYAAGTLLTVALGFWAVSRMTIPGNSNIHGLSTGAYIASKSVWNLLANWLGLRLWRPTFEWSCAAPLLQWKIPILKYQVVLCDWHPDLIVATWTNFLGTLSLSFAFLAIAWRRTYFAGNKPPTLLLVITIYSLLAGIVGTFTGTATNRLVGYGWPLIWIVVPVLFNGLLRSVWPGWMFLHWSLMWIRACIPEHWSWLELAFCVLMIVLNLWVYRRVDSLLKEQQAWPVPPLSEVALGPR